MCEDLGQVVDGGENISESGLPIDESRWESFCESSFCGEVEEQLSFKYQGRGLENGEMVNAKVVAQEHFDV